MAGRAAGGGGQAGPDRGPAEYEIEGERYPRVPFGAETDEAEGTPAACPDCGTGPGALHTPGCEGEECPLCQYPVHDCDCEIGPPG